MGTSEKISRIVIVGGGFGGISAAKVLAASERSKRRSLDIVILDQRNHHLFQPLLYQVAMAGLSPAEIAFPIRSILSAYPSVRVLLGKVTGINLKERKLQTDFCEMPYDALILACGSQHSYFGHNDWEEIAPGLKTLEQATEIRRRVLEKFELAERETDPEIQKRLLTFVVIGGGPTGVELAGSLGEISRFTLARDFRRIDPKLTRIVLVEAGSRILPQFPEELASRATRDLEKLGVQVWTHSRVTGMDLNGILVKDERLSAATILWAAGVKPSSLNAQLGVPLDSQGRIRVSKDLSIPSNKEVFVIGDQACFEIDDGKTLPGLAPVAMQQGRKAALNLLAFLDGKPTQEFKYHDKGQMATIGRNKAILQLGDFKASGFFAWAIWLFVHIYYLIGFKNRIFVFLQWAWFYLSYRRGARLIVNKNWRSFDETETGRSL